MSRIDPLSRPYDDDIDPADYTEPELTLPGAELAHWRAEARRRAEFARGYRGCRPAVAEQCRREAREAALKFAALLRGEA